jgi:DNA-binding NtrC family response regulator
LRTASALRAEHESWLDWQHLPDELVDELRRPGAATTPLAAPLTRTAVEADAGRSAGLGTGPASGSGAASNSLEQHARQLVHQALQASGGNVSQAARTLGISRQTLYKKMAQLQGTPGPQTQRR